jgi:hypothetical protein
MQSPLTVPIWWRTAFHSPFDRLSVAGNYSFVTNRDSLRRMLRRTELPWTVLEKFETGIYSPKGANLPAVELSEKTLTQIAYFID